MVHSHRADGVAPYTYPLITSHHSHRLRARSPLGNPRLHPDLTPTSYLLLALTGLVAGFVDAIAGGGGLLTVPVLLWAGLPPQAVLGTNKFQSSFGTALAAANYARAGFLRWRELRLGIVLTALAAMAGAL